MHVISPGQKIWAEDLKPAFAAYQRVVETWALLQEWLQPETLGDQTGRQLSGLAPSSSQTERRAVHEVTGELCTWVCRAPCGVYVLSNEACSHGCVCVVVCCVVQIVNSKILIFVMYGSAWPL